MMRFDRGSGLKDIRVEVTVMSLTFPSCSLKSCWGKELQTSRPCSWEEEEGPKDESPSYKSLFLETPPHDPLPYPVAQPSRKGG